MITSPSFTRPATPPPAKPERRAKTHVLLVIDMSGSMYSLAADVRGGFNSYIDGLRADGSCDYRITASVFDTEVMPICVSAKLPKVPVLTEALYRPRGGTALFDAIGKTITGFEGRAAKLHKKDRVLLVVNTDGQENSSVEYSRAVIRKMIADRQAGGHWACLFLGAGEDAVLQAPDLGFDPGTTVLIRPGARGVTSTYNGLIGGTRSYAMTGLGTDAAGAVAREMTQDPPS